VRRLVLLCATLSLACPGPVASVDSAGVARPDGGRLVDAGIPVDAGATVDAGGSVDAGEALDAGAPVETPDAGPSPDAGEPTVDAGTVTDAGATFDAGPPLDAGVPVDGGPVDAGPPGLFPIEGFGAATRGGWQPGHDDVLVTSLSNAGPGTLREALDTATGPRVVRFALDGIIALTSSLLVPSNLTIDGRGHRITLTGKGLILVGSDDVIITNLAIVDVGPNSEDGLRIGDPTGGPSERVVIDHVTFRATGNLGDSSRVDEAISVIFGSRDITLSWVKIDNWEKFILIGNGDAAASVDSVITVSLHHVFTTATGRRHPQARYGVIDLWNCFFDDWRMYDWFFLAPYRESFGVQAQDSARIRFENSFVRRGTHSRDSGSQANQATRCESLGRIDSVNVLVALGSTAPLQFGVGCSGATGWTRPYPIMLDAADPALLLRLQAQAGNTL
jgi:pectate lyase